MHTTGNTLTFYANNNVLNSKEAAKAAKLVTFLNTSQEMFQQLVKFWELLYPHWPTDGDTKCAVVLKQPIFVMETTAKLLIKALSLKEAPLK